MMKTACSNRNHVQGFSTGEKIVAQGFFNSMILLGVAGLWNTSPMGALLYLGYAVGSFTLLMRYSICPRCPHLNKAGDCLFVPPSFARAVISKNRSGSLNNTEKVIFYAAFGGTMLLPVPFLLSTPVILAVFLVSVGGTVFFVRTRICRKKCRVAVCPFHPEYGMK